MRGVVSVLERLAAGDLDELRGLPAVTAEHRHGDAQLAGLLYDESDLVVVTRHTNALGISPLDGRELCFEVLVLRGVLLLHHDLAAGRREGVAEILAQPIAIGRRHVREHRHPRELERLAGELRDESALEGIGEAHPEDAVADLGDLGIGGRRRDHGDARCLTHRTGLE